MTVSLTNNFLLAPLFVLAAGYIIHSAPICRLWGPKSTGHVLYFRTIATGLFCLSLCFFLAHLYGFVSSKFELSLSFLTLESITRDMPIQSLSLAVFFTSLIFRIFSYFFVKIRSERWKHNLDIKILNEKGLDQLVYTSIRANNMITITLNNNKVYIGWSFYAPDYDDEKWLRIIPLWSGYRNEKLEIEIQKNYFAPFHKYPVSYQPMLISVEKIVTAQSFEEKNLKKVIKI